MIELLVIRHGIAEDPETLDDEGSPIDDRERRLTGKGRARMAEIAKGLQWAVPELDVVASSPLVRAVETAEVVAGAYRRVAVERIDALAPDAAPEDLVQWLADQSDGTRAAVVGHEPNLGNWCSWVLTGGPRSFLHFKKGGACLLAWPASVAPGEAELVWLASPRQLRRLKG